MEQTCEALGDQTKMLAQSGTRGIKAGVRAHESDSNSLPQTGSREDDG